ncbi:MAG: hypothetical protein L6408_03990, partial [Nanoarchaeota archaeon]|nr:hypothetical protein [Nanoarchaeota archaeon]
MKKYQKSKGLSKRTKLGLVTAAIYAATYLGLPAYASLTQDKEPVKQEIAVEQKEISPYQQTLAEYALDGKITSEEIKGLKELNLEPYENFNNEKKNLEESLAKGKLSLNDLDVKIKHYGWQVAVLSEQIDPAGVKSFLEEKKKIVEDKILPYYPGLLDDKTVRIVYSSSLNLEKVLADLLNKVIKETDEFLKTNYVDDSLEVLGNNVSDVKKLVSFYNIVESELKRLDSIKKMDNNELIVAKKQELQGKIDDFQSGRNDLTTNIITLENKLKELEKSSLIDMKDYNMFNEYLSLEASVKEFRAGHRDFSRFYTLSVLDIMDSYSKYGDSRSKFDKKDGIIEGIENYFASNGLNVEVNDFSNPTRPKF